MLDHYVTAKYIHISYEICFNQNISKSDTYIGIDVCKKDDVLNWITHVINKSNYNLEIPFHSFKQLGEYGHE